MSFAIDVNILLYASNSASLLHEPAAAFIRGCAQGREVFYLAWPTVMGYLRMVTHPRIFDQPLSHATAAANIEALTKCPHCRVIGETEDFWPLYRQLTGDVPTHGNLVPDAHLAAILRGNGVSVLYTRDRDFRKFRFIDARDPLE